MTGQMGRPPMKDGRETKSMPVRMSPEDRAQLRALVETKSESTARVAGDLLRDALRLRVEDNERYRAQQAWAHEEMRRALKDGRLIRAELCQDCGRRTTRGLHGHHWNGYAPEQALDVRWLCPSCHGKVHTGDPSDAGLVRWTLVLKLASDTVAVLESLACERGVTVNTLVREVVEEWYANTELLVGIDE